MTSKTTSAIHIGMMTGVLALIAWASVRSYWAGGWTGDLAYFTLAACAWFLVSLVIEIAAHRLNWDVGLSRGMSALVGAHVLVMAMGFAAGSGGLAVRVLAGYCFLAAIGLGPARAVFPAFGGLVAYATFFRLPDWDASVPFFVAAVAALAAVLCGSAWRVGVPVLWHTVHAFSAPEAVAPVQPVAAAVDAATVPGPVGPAEAPADRQAEAASADAVKLVAEAAAIAEQERTKAEEYHRQVDALNQRIRELEGKLAGAGTAADASDARPGGPTIESTEDLLNALKEVGGSAEEAAAASGQAGSSAPVPPPAPSDIGTKTALARDQLRAQLRKMTQQGPDAKSGASGG